MVFYCWSSLRVRNPCQRVYILDCRTKCEQIKRSVHLNTDSNFVYVLKCLIINLIKSHLFSIEFPSSISVLCSFCISSSSSSPFYFRAICIANTHLHSECLKDCSYLYFVLISICRKKYFFVLSFLFSYLFNSIVPYQILLLNLL